MRRLLPLLLLVIPACSGTKSQLEPAEPLTALDGVETAQLCRYTTDVLDGVETACDPYAPPALGGFDACTSDPPWDECPVPADEPNDVGSWEDCVNALSGETCGAFADERCWHFRCR